MGTHNYLLYFEFSNNQSLGLKKLLHSNYSKAEWQSIPEKNCVFLISSYNINAEFLLFLKVLIPSLK